MKIDNFIWGGCSYSAGSGFTDRPRWENPENDFSFAHKDLKQYFEEPHNVGNVKSQIEKIVFPYQVGKILALCQHGDPHHENKEQFGNIYQNQKPSKAV